MNTREEKRRTAKFTCSVFVEERKRKRRHTKLSWLTRTYKNQVKYKRPSYSVAIELTQRMYVWSRPRWEQSNKHTYLILFALALRCRNSENCENLLSYLVSSESWMCAHPHSILCILNHCRVCSARAIFSNPSDNSVQRQRISRAARSVVVRDCGKSENTAYAWENVSSSSSCRRSCDPGLWIYFEEFVPRAILLWFDFLHTYCVNFSVHRERREWKNSNTQEQSKQNGVFGGARQHASSLWGLISVRLILTPPTHDTTRQPPSISLFCHPITLTHSHSACPTVCDSR